MDQLASLLNEIECISFQEIAELPEPNQHVIVEHLEQLQDELKKALQAPHSLKKHYLVNI